MDYPLSHKLSLTGSQGWKADNEYHTSISEAANRWIKDVCNASSLKALHQLTSMDLTYSNGISDVHSIGKLQYSNLMVMEAASGDVMQMSPLCMVASDNKVSHQDVARDFLYTQATKIVLTCVLYLLH